MPTGIYERTAWHKKFMKEHARRTIAKKGKVPWNKGKKFSYKPVLSKRGKPTWNKGIFGEKSHTWKGNKVGNSQLHKWIYKHLGRPNKCEDCGTTKSYRFEWANKSGKYKRDLNDYKRLCLKCHRKFDKHFGETHHLAKLTDKNVIKIRSLYSTGKFSGIKIAIKFKVSPSLIYGIVNRHKWVHIK